MKYFRGWVVAVFACSHAPSGSHAAVKAPPTSASEGTCGDDCACDVGYEGPSCVQCTDGYTAAGGNSCEPCACNGHSATCDASTGSCGGCADNTAGPHCEFCATDFFGHHTACMPIPPLPPRPQSMTIVLTITRRDKMGFPRMPSLLASLAFAFVRLFGGRGFCHPTSITPIVLILPLDDRQSMQRLAQSRR